MAAKTKTPKDDSQEEKVEANEKTFATKYFQAQKEYHYNLVEEVKDYCVSSGSVILDAVLGGGFGKGLFRLTGVTEGGKTSCALTVMKNLFSTVPNSKGLYVKAEGRLGPEVQARSGLKFVYSPEEWEVGTCLVFECNVFETVFDFIRGLLKNNPNKCIFGFVIDSADGLIPQGDLEKQSTDAVKVAGGALLSSDFFKRVSLGMSKFGHMGIFLSQVRAKVEISQYAPKDQNNRTNSSGGNAHLHYPDWILEFQKPYKADFIAKNDEAPLSLENPPIGHFAKVLICKSPNESTGMLVKYPIKHGRVGGKSVWIEREVIDMLLMFEFIEKKKSWFAFDEEIKAYCLERGIELKSPVQGMDKLYALIESDEKLASILTEFVKENCLKK
jgi:hypothetical protein